MEAEKVSLYFKSGPSDKVYHLQLEAKEPGWVVNFQYGRRNGALQVGTKTQSPAVYAQAKQIYDKLKAEKTAKGYTEGEAGTPFAGTENAGKVTGLIPQLLNPIDAGEMALLGANDGWFMQEKKDGVRLMVRKVMTGPGKATVTGSNRKGLEVELVYGLGNELAQVPGTFILDGELVGSDYWVFDILELNGEDLRATPAIDRWLQVKQLLENVVISYRKMYYVELVPTAITLEEKRALYQTLVEERAEGLVFKQKSAPYISGRPNSGGTQLKFKFTQTATVRVASLNSVRSVAMDVAVGEKATRGVGNVTIPVNQEIPEPGTLIEVRYLYAYPNGALYQPVFVRVRDDVAGPDQHNSLKFKADEQDDDDGL